MNTTVGAEIGRLISALGVDLVVGRPLGRLKSIPVSSPELACLIADMAGRTGSGYGAAFLDDGILHLSSKPGGTARPRTVRDLDEVATELGLLDDHRHLPRTVALHLDLDLDEEIEVPARLRPPDDGVVVTLHPSIGEMRLAIVVGPGVARGGFTEGLTSLASRCGVPVFNTWGAKGVFRWDSPYHGGTIGLQERDVELAGLADADVVITAGLDPDEALLSSSGGMQIQDVEPWQLAALTHEWDVVRDPPAERSPLYEALATVVTPMYESAATPLSPARAALHLSGARPASGVVVAQPGAAGFWVARTYPTGELGAVVVPATVEPGSAIAAVVAAGAIGVPIVAVVDELSPVDHELLELASSLGVSGGVQVWSDHGPVVAADEHARLTERQFAAEGIVVEPIGVATAAPGPLAEVAGPIVAWPTLAGSTQDSTG